MRTLATLVILVHFALPLIEAGRYSSGYTNSKPNPNAIQPNGCIPLNTGLTCTEVRNQNGPPGRFIPECNSDGSYQALQRFPSTGYSCCVDANGKQLQGPGTYIKGPGQNVTLDC